MSLHCPFYDSQLVVEVSRIIVLFVRKSEIIVLSILSAYKSIKINIVTGEKMLFFKITNLPNLVMSKNEFLHFPRNTK